MKIDNRSLWIRLYRKWLTCNCDKIDFYREQLPGMWPTDRPLPCRAYFYKRFRQLDQQNQQAENTTTENTVGTRTENAKGVVNIVSGVRDCVCTPNLHIAEVSRDALNQILTAAVPSSARRSGTGVRQDESCERLFRMRLPNGTLVEFATTQAESIAVKMATAHFEGGSL